MNKNDNLPQADGQNDAKHLSDETNAIENAFIAEQKKAEESEKEHIEVEPVTDTPTVEGTNKASQKAEDHSTTHEDTMVEESEAVQNATDPIIDENEEADKDENQDNTVEIPEKEYETMNQKELIDELRQLMQEYPINSFRDQAEKIKKNFEKRDAEIHEEEKAKFEKENPPSDDPLAPQFEYINELTKVFNDLHRTYRKEKGEFQRKRRAQQEANLVKRREIIEGIKTLITEEENIGTTFKKFHDLQENWRSTGPIPHDAYNITWEDYRLATQNFYDYIDLSKELRDKDFERNLELRHKIIARAEELGQEDNIHKALRELQELHRMWKEDVGPVAQEHRDPTWESFKAATKVIHDKRQEFYKEREKQQEHNKMVKENIIAEVQKITETGAKSHKEWQDRLKEIDVLKELFKNTGAAPKDVNNDLWDQYRSVTREFNRAKNNFYKELKDEQNENLKKKMDLIAIAEEHQNSEDFAGSLQVMKRIQADWKKIGHVPRKDSDKIWKRFQKACNAFFDKKNAQKEAATVEEKENYEAKLKIYDALKEMLPQDDKEAMKSDIQSFMDQWSAIGRVPYSKRFIQDKFEKLVKAKFKATGLSEVDAEMLKYQNKLSSLENGNERDFKNERFYLRKRQDEIKKEILQLQNNLQFFNSKDDKNPLILAQKKNIADLQKELDVVKEKQKQVNILERQLAQQEEVTTEVTSEE